MRLSDLKTRIEAIIRKQGNLRVFTVNSEGEVDNFSIAGFSSEEFAEDCVLIIAEGDRVKNVQQEPTDESAT